MQGAFIVFEGPDGSGTTTHSRMLADRLRSEGKNVWLTAEPTDGPIGQGIRELLEIGGVNGAALQLLFSADRADHMDQIALHLDSGEIVICDRYVPSTIAYGSALGLDVHWLKNVNAAFRSPDHTFLLLPPLATCLERLSTRRKNDVLEDAMLAERVHGAYALFAEGQESTSVIDTSGDTKEAAEQIFREVISMLE